MQEPERITRTSHTSPPRAGVPERRGFGKKKLSADSPPDFDHAGPKGLVRFAPRIQATDPMSRSRPLPLCVIPLALALAGTAVTAQAQGRGRDDKPQPPPQDAPRPAREDSLSDAVRRIERANRGRVLSADRMEFDGHQVNRIKVIDDDGRVRVYMDEPQQTERPRGDTPPPPRRRRDD